MNNYELGNVLLAVLLLMGANLLGQLFTRLRQPKVVGEILAGILLGPTLLGKVAPGFAADLFGADKSDPQAIVLGFLYNFGMLMLMFVAGARPSTSSARRTGRPPPGSSASAPRCPSSSRWSSAPAPARAVHGHAPAASRPWSSSSPAPPRSRRSR